MDGKMKFRRTLFCTSVFAFIKFLAKVIKRQRDIDTAAITVHVLFSMSISIALYLSLCSAISVRSVFHFFFLCSFFAQFVVCDVNAKCFGGSQDDTDGDGNQRVLFHFFKFPFARSFSSVCLFTFLWLFCRPNSLDT